MPVAFINYGEVMLRFVEKRIALADQRELEMIDEVFVLEDGKGVILFS